MEKTISTSQKPLLTIRPSSGWNALDLKELIQFRDLLFVLALRDIKLRYRQTAFGPIWIVLQPLMAAGVFSFVFGTVAHLKGAPGVPPFLFTFTGLMGWSLFANTVGKVSSSLTGSAHLVSKVYFPRLILPLSTICSVLFDFAIACSLLVVQLVFFHIWPGVALLTLPIWIALLLMISMGIGLCTAAVMVTFRDAGTIIGVLVSFLMYASPVMYSVANVPTSVRPYYLANPVAGLLEGFRWSVLGSGDFNGNHIFYAVIISLIVFVAGAYSFKRMERRFADVI